MNVDTCHSSNLPYRSTVASLAMRLGWVVCVLMLGVTLGVPSASAGCGDYVIVKGESAGFEWQLTRVDPLDAPLNPHWAIRALADPTQPPPHRMPCRGPGCNRGSSADMEPVSLDRSHQRTVSVLGGPLAFLARLANGGWPVPQDSGRAVLFPTTPERPPQAM